MYDYFLKYEIVRFPLYPPLTINSVKEPKELVPIEPKFVEISAMRVMSLDGIRLILVARNDETALLINNTFLPGQTKEVNFIKQQAFYQGIASAIKQLRK